MILHRNLMKLEKAFTGEHMEVLLAWNYILSQSCLQMNIFWLLTQSQVALCLTPDRVYIGQVQGINGQLNCSLRFDTGANMRVMAFEEHWKKKKLAAALYTQIIKLAENQIIKWVCLDNQSCSIHFWLTENRNCGPTTSQQQITLY